MPKRQNMKENRELRKQHKQAERDAKKFAALAAKHLCAYKLARSREKAAVAAHERLSKNKNCLARSTPAAPNVPPRGALRVGIGVMGGLGGQPTTTSREDATRPKR